jgi:hypothetical protein
MPSRYPYHYWTNERLFSLQILPGSSYSLVEENDNPILECSSSSLVHPIPPHFQRTDRHASFSRQKRSLRLRAPKGAYASLFGSGLLGFHLLIPDSAGGLKEAPRRRYKTIANPAPTISDETGSLGPRRLDISLTFYSLASSARFVAPLVFFPVACANPAPAPIPDLPYTTLYNIARGPLITPQRHDRSGRKGLPGFKRKRVPEKELRSGFGKSPV